MTLKLRSIQRPAALSLPPTRDLRTEDRPQVDAKTYSDRCQELVHQAGCSWVLIYADREHSANMNFLTGFEPRWEEAILLLGWDGRRVLIVGNECQPYASTQAALPEVEILLSQSLSLMGQDRSQAPKLDAVFEQAGVQAGQKIGLVGWKYLAPEETEAGSEVDSFVPQVVVNKIRAAVGASGEIYDVTRLLMAPDAGLRVRNSADQIAAFEWSASRSSAAVWRMIEGADVGLSEFEIAAAMVYEGDILNAHVILSTGDSTYAVDGLRSPTLRRTASGDGITACVPFTGGLCARAGLLAEANDEFLAIAKCYFKSLARWYETADIGTVGGVINEAVLNELAKGGLRPALNPGHLMGHDEWLHSPVFPGSTLPIQSGMIIQVDVIPTPMPTGWTLNCEDVVVFADNALQHEIAERFPATFDRMQARRHFMQTELGIKLAPSILPMSSTPMCLTPFWLRPDLVLTFA